MVRRLRENENHLFEMKSAILLFILFALISCTDSPSLSLYITNATIIDGSGSEPFISNVGIKDNQIIYLSENKLKISSATKVIDGTGKILAPGFIDLHAHGNLEKTPAFENFLAMGVTTITLGQDGSSPHHRNLGPYLDSTSKNGLGLNIAMFAGHGTLRKLAGIGTNPSPSKSQMDSLLNILDDQLEYCFGLSTGLEYSPGLNAQEKELLALAKVVGNRNRLIMSHMRNEDDNEIINSINELALQGEFCKVHIAHIKSVYGKGEKRALEILDHIKDLRSQEINITADIYPYTASYTGISILFPEWSKTKDQYIKIKDKRRTELASFLKKKVESRNGPQATLLGTAPYAGKTLLDLENEWGVSYVDILIDTIGPQGASGAYFVMDEKLQETLIKDSLIAFCSDGSPTGYHPRGHGTFARVIEEMVYNRNALTLVEAIRKMTSYPAKILGISDRGLIKKGYKADLVLFDPSLVKEKASYENPHQFSEGFDLVIVNGHITRQNAKLSKAFYGEILNPN